MFDEAAFQIEESMLANQDTKPGSVNTLQQQLITGMCIYVQ